MSTRVRPTQAWLKRSFYEKRVYVKPVPMCASKNHYPAVAVRRSVRVGMPNNVIVCAGSLGRTVLAAHLDLVQLSHVSNPAFTTPLSLR